MQNDAERKFAMCSSENKGIELLRVRDLVDFENQPFKVLDAIKHQGSRTELTCGQNVHKLKSRDLVGEVSGESGRQIPRYIRLTQLIFQLMDKVNEKSFPSQPEQSDHI
ncbi:MAG: hypothetical protein ACI4DP_02375 [Candidatus Ornithomonoglobus sp.]